MNCTHTSDSFYPPRFEEDPCPLCELDRLRRELAEARADCIELHKIATEVTALGEIAAKQNEAAHVELAEARRRESEYHGKAAAMMVQRDEARALLREAKSWVEAHGKSKRRHRDAMSLLSSIDAFLATDQPK